MVPTQDIRDAKTKKKGLLLLRRVEGRAAHMELAKVAKILKKISVEMVRLIKIWAVHPSRSETLNKWPVTVEEEVTVARLKEGDSVSKKNRKKSNENEVEVTRILQFHSISISLVVMSQAPKKDNLDPSSRLIIARNMQMINLDQIHKNQLDPQETKVKMFMTHSQIWKIEQD